MLIIEKIYKIIFQSRKISIFHEILTGLRSDFKNFMETCVFLEPKGSGKTKNLHFFGKFPAPSNGKGYPPMSKLRTHAHIHPPSSALTRENVKSDVFLDLLG